mgnify:CR=1 FL=1
MPIIGPYVLTGDISDANKDRGDDDKVPVGSLRFLRNQAEMESDMNTRRVLAGREMTGDSGIFSEVRLIVDAAANNSRTLDLNQSDVLHQSTLPRSRGHSFTTTFLTFLQVLSEQKPAPPLTAEVSNTGTFSLMCMLALS